MTIFGHEKKERKNYFPLKILKSENLRQKAELKNSPLKDFEKANFRVKIGSKFVVTTRHTFFQKVKKGVFLGFLKSYLNSQKKPKKPKKPGFR